MEVIHRWQPPIRTFIWTALLLCSVWAQTSVPWYLANAVTIPLTASNAIIIDAVYNNTHLVVLDSFFRLRYFIYSPTSASLVRTTDISSSMGAGVVGNLYSTSRYNNTAALGINPFNGDVFVVTYSPFSSSKFSLNVHKVNVTNSTTVYRVYDSKDSAFWNVQYKNPRIKLSFEGTNYFYIGFFNYPDGTATGSWLARVQYTTTSIYNPKDALVLNGQNAYSIDFECISGKVCVWTTSRTVTTYLIPMFGGSGTTNTPNTSPELHFDPSIASSAGVSYFLHRMLNDTSRFVVHARDSAFASLGASISPYVVNNAFDQSNFDIEVDGGQIYTGFTSTFNSSVGLGDSEIVISQYNMSYHLQSSLIVSTARFDSLNRLVSLSGNKLMVVGMTEGDLSNPTSNTGSRKAFVAHFQYVWISSLSNASPGYVRGGESFLIGFSSLPSSASLSTPSVTLNGRMCTIRGWVGQTLNVTAPYGIGGPHQLRIVFSYLPFTPTVNNSTLSYPPPVLQSINVTQGPAVGYPIRLNVSNLGLIGQDSVTVTVAGQQCRNITQVNSLQLTCVTPAGTGINNRVVVSAGINLNSTEVHNISYDPPTFHQIAPSSGPTIGGNEIALHGKNLGPCALIPCNSTIHKVSISIGGLPCTNPLLWNDSLVRCLPPSGVGVGHSILVVVDGQQGVNNSVTYAYDIPKIALLVPSTSLSTIPTVYIEGENFGFNLTLVEVLFTETVNATVYTCESLLLRSNNNIRCDFSSIQLPNDATFNITVVVANQYSTITSGAKFRTGVANSSPAVHPYNETLNEDSTLVVVLQGNDPDPGDFITFFVSSTTTHGNLYQFSSSALNSQGPIIDTSLSPVAIQDPLARLVYIPFNEFSGIDSFTFLGRDGSNSESNIAFGNITVKPVADPPIPKAVKVELNEDTPTVISFDVMDPDTEAGNVTVIIMSIPPLDKGELYEIDEQLNVMSEIVSAPCELPNFRKRVLYVPPLNAYGLYFSSFSYKAVDDTTASLTDATVTISIIPVNDMPVAHNKSYTMLEDTGITVSFDCTDADREEGLFTLIESVPPAEAGTLFQTDVRYMAPIFPGDRLPRLVALFYPKENYFGETSIIFRCADKESSSNSAFIDIEIRNVNDLPTAHSLSVVSEEDRDVIIEFPLFDIETPAENLTILIMDLPRRGILHYPLLTNGSTIWIPINDTGFVVPDCIHTLMFRPPPDANGDPFAIFPYLVDDGSDKSSSNGTVTIIINPVNDPPYLDKTSLLNLSVEEDGELTITMKVDDVDYDGRLSVKITNLRINGTLYHVNRQTGANSGLAVGEGSEISGPPFQVIYVPAKDFASSTPDMFQRFNVSFSDSGTNSVTNSEEIVFPVIPINDAPKIDCSSPYIVLPQENLTYPYTVAEFQISAYDIDDTDLRFYVSSLPIRGVLMDASTANPIEANTPFSDPNLRFNSSGTAGGNPYGNFTIYAKDKHGSESVRCTFQFTVNCPPGLVNNILRDIGPICVACPSGAVCSQDGITPARARPGYWLSDDKVTFLPCFPREACPGTAESNCAPGYKGIRCGQCDRNYYKLANLCQKCPTDVSMKLFIVAGILVVAGILLLLFVRYSKGPILGLFGILVNFLQSVILLQHLRIEWPQEFYDLMSRLSIVNINVEIASPECLSSDLVINFSLKLKLALLSPLLLGGIAMLYFSVAWFIRKSIYQFQPSVVQNWVKAEFKQLGKVLHTLLNILYVHVTTSSLSLFDCYQSPDGYYYLEADPSLRCYETWYIHDLPYAILGTCIYVIGIPLYFSAIYFLLHQTRYTSRFWKESRLVLEELMTFDKNYKREYQFYGVLQLYHKLAVILVNVFLTKYGGFQIIFTQVLLLIWLQLFLRYRPFISDTLNRLEILSHICILSVLGAGLPFRLDELDPSNPLQKVLVVFITLVICGFILLILIAALGEVWSKLKLFKESRGQKNEGQSRNMYQSSVILLPTKLQ